MIHHGVGVQETGWSVYVFVAAWTLMIAAMMLPASLPFVARFYGSVRDRADGAVLTALLVAGYLWIWTLFGLLLHSGDQLVTGSTASAWLVLAAGLYQLTPLKRRCLERCLSRSVAAPAGRDQAFRLGVHHGLLSAGCCWGLMLLMFVAAIGNLAGMVLLAAVMAVETNVIWARRLSAPLGVALVGSGIVFAALGGA